jgi:hypothetical protein
MTLPDCMMPDGAEPCAAFADIYDEVKLRRNQVKELTAQRDALNGDVWRLGAQIEQARAALCEPDTSDAYYNLEGALIDIKRFIEKGEPTDEVCVRTIERVQAQIAAACRALAQPEGKPK